jgi:hypothetical protein
MAQSLLATDGYKFSMAEAGWPLRTETFYYSHRKGGPQVLPVDVPACRAALRPASSARRARPRPRATRPGAQHRPIRSTPSSSAPETQALHDPARSAGPPG